MTPQFPVSEAESAEFAPEPAPADLHLSEYWAIIKKRRRLVALCVGVALVIGVLMSVTTKPKYRGTVVLDIEKDKPSLLDAGTGDRFVMDSGYLATQIQLMKSREMGERVVRKLKLLENRELNPTRSGLIAGTRDKPASSAQVATTALAQMISNGVVVTPVRDTNILKLSYTAFSASLAAEIANGVAEAYIDWSVEAKFNVVGLASEFLKSQIDALKKDLDAKQQQLLAYGRQKDIVSGEAAANAPLQNLEAFNREYAVAVSDRVAKEARYHEVRTAKPESIADTLSNGLVTGLRAELSRLERDYAEKLNLYKPEWPAMKQLQVQIEKSREHLESVTQETVSKARDLARNDYETALRREGSLKAVLVPQKQEVMNANSNAVEYNNLRLQVEAKRQQLDTLLKQEAQTEMTSRLRGERVSSARIVDRALPDWAPFTPNYRRAILLSLIAGGALGVGLALFLSYMDRSLRSVEDVVKHLHLPALGVIPSLKSVAARAYGYSKKGRGREAAGPEESVAIELLPHLQPRSVVAESYRAVRAALLLSRAGGVKSIVVTSGFPAEGKTSTAVNLAVVLGQLGKRVVLVDADLHRPRLHEVFHVSNRVGLVSVLAEGLEPTRAILTTDIPEVFLVPAGPSTPNPSGLLASEAMSKFLELAKLNFDYVIVDAPPVAPVADALVIGNQTDGAVICVLGGKTPREQVARIRDKLLWANVRILGVVLSNLPEGSADEYEAAYLYEDTYHDVSAQGSGQKRLATAARRI
ncbi:MAG: polysaccharide biosynthesis tyrosine autokinase [Acidobacteriota bacterium]|nr:polysaccharide biosynthesis tyrosine autokinase [Acidobacteriota bacterium]